MPKYSCFLKDNPSVFPYDYERRRIHHTEPDIMHHWHQELEITYVNKGTASYHIDTEQLPSQVGDIILIQPTAMHAIYPIDKNEELSTTLHIHLDHLGRNTIDVFSQRYIQPIYSGHSQLTPRISPSDAGYEAIKNYLLELFNLIDDRTLL